VSQQFRIYSFGILIFVFVFSSSTYSQAIVTITLRQFGSVGNGRQNDHNAFLKAAQYINKRGGNVKLIIPRGIYLVGKQLRDTNQTNYFGVDLFTLTNCKNVTIVGNGAIIRYSSKLYFGSFEPGTVKPYHSNEAVFAKYNYAAFPGEAIYLIGCQNITIRYLNLDGNCSSFIKGGKFGDAGFQLPHDGIFIRDCSSVILDSISANHFGRDGLIVSNTTPKGESTADQKISLTNCEFLYNGRQAFSWVGGIGLKASRCKFNHTGRSGIYSAPGAGVDIEAETGMIRKGIFDGCEFINNSGCGMVADNGDSRDVQFTNCIFWGTTIWSIWPAKPEYTFTSCKIYGSMVHGCDAVNEKDATKFIKCSFEDLPYKGKPVYGNFLVEINYRKRLRFIDCNFTNHSRRLMWVDCGVGWTKDEKPLFDNCNFYMKNQQFKYPDYWSKQWSITLKDVDYYLSWKKNDADKYFISGGNYSFSGKNLIHYTDATIPIAQ
jgi:hypothetical protein